VWSGALERALAATARYAPDVLVVSLGVDTYERDPISAFRLRTDDYPRLGERIASLGLPTVFILEGGYAVAEIGANVVGVLRGYG
jgi:acetoin utilization deacetylase AcuC-like enzyme